MPSSWHDTVNELFKDYSDFAAEFLRLADVDIGAGARTWLGQNVLGTRGSAGSERAGGAAPWLARRLGAC